MRFILLSLPLLLAACAGAPIEQPAPPAPNPSWGYAPTASEAAGWAPLLDPTLQSLQAQALKANTDIRRAALALQAQELRARQQGLRIQPSASLSYSANRPLKDEGATINVDGVLVPVGQAAKWSHSYGTSVGAGFELDLWGRLSQLDVQQARLSEAAQADIRAAQQSIAGRVAEGYWTLSANQYFAAIAAEKLKLSEAALPLVTARVREGKLVPLEIGKAAANVQQARQALAQAEAAVDKARLGLAQLLDAPPPGPDFNATVLPKDMPVWSPDQPVQVLERRPDVHRARLEVDAALAGARATRQSRYPQLSFSAGLGTGGARLSDWFAQPLLSLASNLTVPLIDWRRLDLQDALSRNDLDRAALNLRDKVNGALSEVEGLLVDQRRIAAVRSAADQQLLQTQDAARISRLKWEVGTIARADDLQAGIAELDARQAVAQAQLDAVLNRIALLRALAVPLTQ
ncbi:TolC family protein [Burkholderiaceae bacterium UC74_6]